MKHENTVLLVEDDAILSDAFSMMLEKEGYKVQLAYNGKEALGILKKVTPNVILLDLLMPVMDGKEFLKNFRNTHNIPIIVFSNLDSKDDVQEILKLGASKYMLKAWATPQELVRIIKDISRDL